MERLLISITSNDPCSQYAKELLERYLFKAMPSLCHEKGEKEFVLALAKDVPEYSNEAKKITKQDGFAYLLEGDKAIFLSKTTRGLLYSVVTYLQDDVGCRFYHEDEEYIPSLDSIPMPKERVVNPPFEMRNYLCGKCYDDCWEDGYVSPKLEEMTKNRVLDVYTRMDEKHGGVAPVYARNISHNFHYYCPYEIYGKDHPEFFQEIKSGDKKMMTIDITNGIKDEDGSLDDSLSVSVAKIVIEEMKKDIISHPDCSYFSLTQEDGDEYFDDPHNRSLEKKYKRSGLLIRFCNVVVRELRKWAKSTLDREIHLVTFAYSYAKEAPTKEEDGKIVPLDPSVVADEGMVIQLALFSNSFYSYFSPKQLPEVSKCMREWRAIAKRFWFWAYDIDYANYYAYYDTFHTIKENVRGFHDYGIEYLLMQGTHDAERNWQSDARSYVYDRLMWDMNLDEKKLLEEYLAAYYGPAASYVSSFISLFHDRFVYLFGKGEDIRLGTWGNENYPSVLPKDLVLKGLDILKEGRNAVLSSKLDEANKGKFIKRLSGVMTTPLNTLYLNFDAYYPNGDENKKKEIKEEFIRMAKTSGETRARETFTIERYIDFVESDEYKIRPIYKNGRFSNGGEKEEA